MPNLIMLCGLPGVGKDTWIENMGITDNHYFIYSTDREIERAAHVQRKTYNEVFYDLIKEAERFNNSYLKEAIWHGKNIIWNQTNLTPKPRKRKIDMVKSLIIEEKVPWKYRFIAINFHVVDRDRLWDINNERASVGRNLADYMLERMMETFVPAESDSDPYFDYIYDVERGI